MPIRIELPDALVDEGVCIIIHKALEKVDAANQIGFGVEKDE